MPLFYVTKISGELVPFDPGAAHSGGIARTAVVQASEGVEERKPVEEIAQSAPALASNTADDGAVYEGHAIPRSGEGVLGNSSGVAWAGGVRSYRVQSSDRVAEALPVESNDAIESIERSGEIGNALGESAQRVTPVRRESHRYPQPEKERKRAVMARDLMSSPVFTLQEDRPIEEARKVFRERKFRHIPVVAASGNLVGILSDRDFIGELPGADATVRERMVTNILTARPETAIQAVAEVMMSHHIGCLPIVDGGGMLLGVLTRSDILRAIVNHAPIELWT